MRNVSRTLAGIAALGTGLLGLGPSAGAASEDAKQHTTAPKAQYQRLAWGRRGAGGGWSRSSTFSGPRGGSFSRDSSGSWGGGSWNRNSTVTGPAGNSWNHSSTGSWDSGSGTYSRDVTTTGPAGNSLSRSKDVHRTDDGFSSSTTVTGPAGNTATRNANGSWDPSAQTWTKNVTTTGPNGAYPQLACGSSLRSLRT